MTATDLPPGIDPAVPPSGEGCVECDASGGWWFHLRRCAQCGHIGCCDTSPAQHATAHARATGHPFITSFEPGEDWFFSYDDEQMYDGPTLADPQRTPTSSRPPARPTGCPPTGPSTCTADTAAPVTFPAGSVGIRRTLEG